jgi:hypothetical protein
MKRRRVILGGIVLVGVICALLLLPSTSSERRAVEKTRRELRQQGFKIDLSEFNFLTSPEMRVRATALTNAVSRPYGYGQPEIISQNFTSLKAVGPNSALVIWKEDKLGDDFLNSPQYSGQDIWQVLRKKCDEDRAPLDAACVAALKGPFRFELTAGNGFAMLLPHLAMLKILDQTLGKRAFLELREGNKDAAWTNLLASTQLATAYEPEPGDISYLVRCACVDISYNITWQVLQYRGWNDAQLADLQSKWESFDVFKGLDETAAFARACAVDLCQRERDQPARAGLTLSVLARSPRSAWPALMSFWQEIRYRHHGTYEDEIALMGYYRDREVQLRRAVQVTTWSEMRNLPGATNVAPFISKYSSRMRSQLNMMQMSRGFIGGRFGLFGRAAESETRRRLIGTALGLERYRVRHGAYPQRLEDLTPEFLKVPLRDFMDGKPLRYLRTDDGHFVLYSVGLDCSDDGGVMPQRNSRGAEYADYLEYGGTAATRSSDLVWPRPAAVAEVQAQRAEEEKMREDKMKVIEKARAEAEVEGEAARRATVQRLLTVKQPRPPEPSFEGRPISEALQRDKPGSKLTLDELLTAHQIITGQEPNVVTLEVPISYDVVTNFGELRLVVDGGQESLEMSLGEMQELVRATNCNCLLTWNTIFDPPGQHALQVELECIQKKGNRRPVEARGPVSPFFSTNICQFNPAYSQYDSRGVTLYAKLPESNGIYNIKLVSPTGEHVKTISGSTSNGIINIHWDLLDEHGRTYTNASLDSVFNVTLPDSGRSQSMKGP